MNNEPLYDVYCKHKILEGNKLKSTLFEKIVIKFFDYIKEKNPEFPKIKTGFSLYILPSDDPITFASQEIKKQSLNKLDAFGNNIEYYPKKPTTGVFFCSYDDKAFTINCTEKDKFYETLGIGNISHKKLSLPNSKKMNISIFNWYFINLNNHSKIFSAITLVALAVLSLLAVNDFSAFGESEKITISPYKQYQQGIPINQILCSDSKILLESARNTPACVNENSVEKLLDRGFVMVTTTSPVSFEMNSEKYVYSGGGIESKGHGTSKFIPALYTIDIPTSLSVGETFSIPYTLSWYHPNGDPVYLDTTITNIEGLRNEIRFFMSEEFTILKEDIFFEAKMADLYSPHYGDWHMFDEYYSSDMIYGTIEVRLDKPLYHDRDMIIFIIGDDELKFQTQRTDDGIVIVASDKLTDEYDKTQFFHTFNHYEDGDTEWRYEIFYNDDVEHVPQIRTAPQVVPDEPQINLYPEDHVWPDLAEFFRNVIKNGGDLSEYLETPTFTQEFIDDFTDVYPEFKLQSARQTTGEQNSPRQFLVYGNYFVNSGGSSGIDIENARVCAYDKNLTTGSHQILLNGQTPVCDITDSNGYFSMHGIITNPIFFYFEI